MKAELITVSSSLLTGLAVNDNASFLTRELSSIGIEMTQAVMIHDSSEKLMDAILRAEDQADIIVITGGLGPNANDIVKTTLSEHLNKPLVLDEDTQNRIITYHKNSDLVMPENNQLQALTLLDSIPLVNITGLALGMFYQSDSHTFILLPGPTDELIPMFNEKTKPLILEHLLENKVVSKKIIRLFGLTMAQAHHDLADLLTSEGNPFIQIYPDGLEIEVEITAIEKDEAKANQPLAKAEQEVEACAGTYIIGTGKNDLPNIVRELLIEKELMITGAESLTGGAFLSTVSSLFEAGSFFEGGVVTYSETIKNEVLEVTKETIKKYGVVSAECAFEMADKTLAKFNADIAVSLTGAAGPSSLEGEIPGTVWIGIARKDKKTFAKKFHFGYKRNMNREYSVWSAFNMVRQVLLGEEIEDVVYASK
ncbi:CinA family nicotinamide mononucleotide deamidase-related protein [Jeotgalibaca sp. A127]|uniref:CinA family nicotinamide mononucleotide deamidase-related protein n=1 Tax=Jeotgalibaca sp. A127 TaxID=3457324 RepID=UPI003FD4EB87